MKSPTLSPPNTIIIRNFFSAIKSREQLSKMNFLAFLLILSLLLTIIRT